MHNKHPCRRVPSTSPRDALRPHTGGPIAAAADDGKENSAADVPLRAPLSDQDRLRAMGDLVAGAPRAPQVFSGGGEHFRRVLRPARR
jgi:hypothetical protein